MTLLTLAMGYRESPLADLERAAIRPEELQDALPCLLRAPDVREAVVLSTCNRVEIYTWAKEPEAATEQVRLFLEDLKQLPMGWTRARTRVLLGDDVIRHLFSVTAGLDSMVTGESEIQGQVRAAYRSAAALGAVGPHLHGLFRWALESGRRTRTSTGLSRAQDSFPRAAVRAIDSTLQEVAGREVLVVGSGRMASASVRALASAGARIGIAARRLEAAEELADDHNGFALPLHAVEDALVVADAAVFATSSPEPLIGVPAFHRVITGRGGRRLTVVDLGLPRNVHPDVAELDGGKDGFHLFDLTRLDRDGFTVPGGREAQIGAAHEVVLIEAERCVAWFRSKPADAVVTAIQARAAQVAETEAAQAARIPGLDERQRAAVEQAIRRTVRKVVHTPTVRAKEACARGDENLLQAARWLFGIDGREEEAVVEPDGSVQQVEGAGR
ncbi:MAG TPA: glutamyl-tRNA reductase [Actinomycetota bacterium]|nr:glutamyl-tRNA reductase [Actinomycetota bacterium]